MDDFGAGKSRDGRVLDFSAATKGAEHALVRRVEAYWEAQRKGRIVPSRSDIDPLGLDGALSHVFIAERISKGLARFRIAGSHMHNLVGLDVRGMPVSAIFESEDRKTLAGGLEEVFDHPSTLHLTIQSAANFGRRRLSGEMMFLPLRSDLGEVSRALGIAVLDGEVGRTPRRLKISRETRRGLTGYAGPEAAQKTSFEQAGNRSNKPLPQTARNQHLRLVADNTKSEF